MTPSRESDIDIYHAIDRGGGQTCDVLGIIRELHSLRLVTNAAFVAASNCDHDYFEWPRAT